MVSGRKSTERPETPWYRPTLSKPGVVASGELAGLAGEVLGDPGAVGAGLGLVGREHHRDVGAADPAAVGPLRVEGPWPAVGLVGSDDLRPVPQQPGPELAAVGADGERRSVAVPPVPAVLALIR